MQRMYRTPKGTELPLLNLRGREYLEVKYRLVWFREDHPDWAIETELISVTEANAYARATIKDGHGRIIATSHKFESKKGFPDFIEKSETGAIGRGLALIGYGTQFCADELDDGARASAGTKESSERQAVENVRPKPATAAPVEPATAQVAPKQSQSQPTQVEMTAPVRAQSDQSPKRPSRAGEEPGDYQIGFGRKYKGLKLRDIPRAELENYLAWLEENAAKKGMPLSDEALLLKQAVDRFLESSPSASRAPAAKTAAPKSPIAQPPNQSPNQLPNH